MNYQDMYYFIKVVEQGSMVAASEKLDIPTSTLSRRIISLEERLGYQLLHRHSRNFGLTDAGRSFYSRLKEQFNTIELEAQNVVSELAGLTGDIRMSAPLALGQEKVSKWVYEFMQQNPRVSIELLLSNHPIDLVKNNVDVALRLGDFEISDWIVREICPIDFKLVASPAFLNKHGRINHPKELEKIATISVSASPLWRLIRNNEQVTINPHGKFRSDVVTAGLDAAINHMGIALLPAYVVVTHLRDGSLREVLPEWRALQKSLRLFYPQRESMPAKHRFFINYLLDKAGTINEGRCE